MAMIGVKTVCHRSLRAPMDTYWRTGSIWPSTSVNLSRFSFHCLQTSSGITSAKRKEVGWSLNFRRTYPIRPSDSSTSRKMLHTGGNLFPLYMSSKPYCRAYSSHTGGDQDGLQSAASSGKATDSGNEWLDVLNNAWKSVVQAAVSAGKKAKEVSDEVVPHIQQLYDSHPYLEKVIVPVGGTLFATILAWFVMPRILRKVHEYAMQSPFSLVSRVPYEKSMWSALEDPARYLITFIAFSNLGVMIAPSTLEYLSQAWRGAAVLSFVWFLHRWKTNYFSSVTANQVTIGLDKDTLMTLEKMSSVGLLILGTMGLAEAFGVPVQSLLTIGGIGGVATAFASRDILGNLFSGLSLQFSKPFSIGDNIKAGSVEGQVVEMGLTTTSLLNPEKFPVIVPNSLFASQVIVNKSRAQWRATVTKIPARVDDLDKIPLISEDIKSMLRSNPKVYIEKEAPYCFLSRIESSLAELTLGCNLINMKREEFLATEQEILLQAARIIKKHGAEL